MKKKKVVRNILILFALLALVVAYFGYSYYSTLYKGNVSYKEKDVRYLYIPTGATMETLIDSLKAKKVLVSEESFLKAAKMKDFTKVKPGRYKLTKGMNNNALVRMLANGNQAPVRLTLAGNIRTKEKLASIVSRYIEPDSTALLAYFNDDTQLAKQNLNSANVLGICILNTYEFYWNTSPEEFVARMGKEYDKFWTDKREAARKQTPWSRMQIITLASIVAEETIKADEMPRVAGVYINRLNTGMLLQADPTIKYALGDFAIKRILDRDKEIDSPYNTYRYTGLPPGPICIPSMVAIDAVLNADKHDYYYFCAKPDGSGYHSFAKTLAQHNQNASEYHKELNKRKIYR